MSNAHILPNREYGINRDCRDEAVKARFRLWADYKNEKHKHRRGKVHIGFPAKLVVEGKVVRDEFPDWRETLKGSRAELITKNTKTSKQVLGRGMGLGRSRSMYRSWVSRDNADSENERFMVSLKSASDDDRNSQNRSPDHLSQAARTNKLPVCSGSYTSPGTKDNYSKIMHRFASASEHMEQPTETGTFRSTLTVTPSKQEHLIVLQQRSPKVTCAHTRRVTSSNIHHFKA